jgi:TonB family protein
VDEKHLWAATLALSFFVHMAFLNLHSFHHTEEQSIPLCVTLDMATPEQAASSQGSLHTQMAMSENDRRGESAADRRRQAFAAYLKQIRKHINANKFQPPGNDFSRMVGKAGYALTILPDGRFAHIRLLRSSGDPDLDRAANLAIHLTSGRIKRPPITGKQPFTLRVTVKYQYGL